MSTAAERAFGWKPPVNGAPVRAPIDKFSLAELRLAYPKLNPPVIDGLAREGETLNIISHTKVGKSWAAYGLALSVITGRPWFDRFETAPGKVLLVDNELHRPTLPHRITAVGDAMGIPAEHYDLDLEVWPLRGRLRSLGDLSFEFDGVAPGEFKLIVLDAKYRFAAAGVSENDNAAETLVYNLLDEIADKTRAVIALIHHTSKGSQADKRVTDVGSGAGAQSRAADAHLILREHEEPGVAVLDAMVRSFPPVEPLTLRWSFPLWLPDEWADPNKLKGRMTVNEQRQQDRDREAFAKIFAAIREHSEATARQLRGWTGLSRERLQRLLDGLEADHQLHTETIDHRGNETKKYTLPKEAV